MQWLLILSRLFVSFKSAKIIFSKKLINVWKSLCMPSEDSVWNGFSCSLTSNWTMFKKRNQMMSSSTCFSFRRKAVNAWWWMRGWPTACSFGLCTSSRLHHALLPGWVGEQSWTLRPWEAVDSRVFWHRSQQHLILMGLGNCQFTRVHSEFSFTY